VPTQKTREISPLFKCDSATLSFYASKGGKITVSFSGWDASKVRFPVVQVRQLNAGFLRLERRQNHREFFRL
jgi:hypothetical protein